MAIINGFTTVASVKSEASIATADTTYDTLIEALINSVSSAITTYLDREIVRTTHTSETYAVNNSQYLYLQEYPVQSVSSAYLGGVLLASNVDYSLDGQSGRLYKATGWVGSLYNRGTFPDAFAGAREIVVTYIAGYYLPADIGYVAGAAASLPLALTFAANHAIVQQLLAVINQSYGVQQYSEGGISTTYINPSYFLEGAGGFDQAVMSQLNPYKRREAI